MTTTLQILPARHEVTNQGGIKKEAKDASRAVTTSACLAKSIHPLISFFDTLNNFNRFLASRPVKLIDIQPALAWCFDFGDYRLARAIWRKYLNLCCLWHMTGCNVIPERPDVEFAFTNRVRRHFLFVRLTFQLRINLMLRNSVFQGRQAVSDNPQLISPFSESNNLICAGSSFIYPLLNHSRNQKAMSYGLAHLTKLHNFFRRKTRDRQLSDATQQNIPTFVFLLLQVIAHPSNLMLRHHKAITQTPERLQSLITKYPHNLKKILLPLSLLNFKMPNRKESGRNNCSYRTKRLYPCRCVIAFPRQCQDAIHKHNDHGTGHNQLEDIRQCESDVKLTIHKWLLAIKNWTRLPVVDPLVHEERR